MDLVYYTPQRLYKYLHISKEFWEQAAFSQLFNASISLIDRSNTINCPPVPIRNLYPLLKWKKSAGFEELCLDRYNRILENAKDKKVIIFYSGGIDSTLIAVLAMMHPDFEKSDNIYLAYTEDSIKENPYFWHDFIVPKFQRRIINALNFHSLIANNNNVCITGELADNIFGSLTLKNYMDFSGDMDAIFKPWRSTGKTWLLNKLQDPNSKDVCDDLLEKIISTSPRTLESNHDCFWWLNFILKWQAVRFRLVSHSPSKALVDAMCKNVVHFFDTEDFQNWAVMTEEPKLEKDWYSYKLPAKKMIFDYNKDTDYFKYKTKYPSIPGLTRYGNMFDFIYYDSKTNTYTASKDLIEDENRT